MFTGYDTTGIAKKKNEIRDISQKEERKERKNEQSDYSNTAGLIKSLSVPKLLPVLRGAVIAQGE